jgi:hypothetical protein
MSRDRNDTAYVERIILIKWCRDNQIRTDVLLKIDFSCSTTELYLYPVPMESSNKFHLVSLDMHKDYYTKYALFSMHNEIYLLSNQNINSTIK